MDQLIAIIKMKKRKEDRLKILQDDQLCQQCQSQKNNHDSSGFRFNDIVTIQKQKSNFKQELSKIKAIDPHNLFVDEIVSFCQKYDSNYQNCEECIEGCKTCTNNIDCEICYEGYYLTNQNPDGLMKCSPCSTFCEECYDGDFCLRCREGFELVSEDAKIICQINICTSKIFSFRI